MALTSGTRLGPYEILSALGAGGMGEVYRARDTKLNRDVAIKVLPDSFANDPERLARLTREAQTLASLNHPNIAHIHGLEESNGVRALVMELVEGEDLSERIARGPIEIDAALPIAKQIAEALEAAHEQGVIHRDLKPANIKVRPDDTVKVLDFGLAKAMETAPAASDLTHSPTLSMMATQAGVILGTAAYMSPEQAKGFPADRRSDVFSFGSVLYEMLTGRQPFKGETAPDVLASVLVREPDLDVLPPNLNPRIPELLRRCLEKSPRKRWQAVGDLRAEIEAIAAAPRVAPAIAQVIAPTQPLWRRAIPVVAAAIVVGALSSIATLYFKPSATPLRTITRFSFTPGESQQFAGNASRQVIAISPDGTKMAYAANFRLYLRSMSELEARPIPGTESTPNATASNPAFSPDGGSIAYWSGADQTLKRIAITGGAAVTICPATSPYGMAWGTGGIVFTQLEGIMRVSANSGQPERLVEVKGGDVVNSPQMLPDGQTLLFTLGANTGSSDRWDRARIVAQSLRSGERKTLIEGGSHARYVATGHLVYAHGGVLFAVPFDLKRLEVTAGPVPIVEGVWRTPASSAGSALFSISDTGSLIYVPGPAVASSAQSGLGLIDRKGVVTPLKVQSGLYDYPRVSPDGTRLAFGTSDGKEAFIMIYELSGATAPRRITFARNSQYPVWAGDLRVAFQSDREGEAAVWWQPADGSPAERLTTPDPGTSHTPESWSPDGQVLLFSETKDAVSSLWTFSLKDRKAAPFGDVKGSSLLTDAMFSPDGRWVAYQVGTAGVTEGTTYVQPFPSTGTKYQIAQGGRPLWSRDGKELFFVPAPGIFMSVIVKTTEPIFTVTSPVSLPRGFGAAVPNSPRTFDIMPDGRIVGVVTTGQSQSGSTGPAQIQVVLNWFEELKSKVPTN
ncbi:MAG: protein kinase [Vicinamibacterales bacterium]|nr:protein kinase [Vicinamibacterales bacterium]